MIGSRWPGAPPGLAWTHGSDGREPRQRPTRLITRDFRDPRPPRRPDFGRSDSVSYEFVQFGRGNRGPETFRGARSLDARRDNPGRPPRASAKHSATPIRWPTPRALDARNLLSQNAVRTPQNANAPAGRPGRSLLTCWPASFAIAHQFRRPSATDGKLNDTYLPSLSTITGIGISVRFRRGAPTAPGRRMFIFENLLPKSVGSTVATG